MVKNTCCTLEIYLASVEPASSCGSPTGPVMQNTNSAAFANSVSAGGLQSSLAGSFGWFVRHSIRETFKQLGIRRDSPRNRTVNRDQSLNLSIKFYGAVLSRRVKAVIEHLSLHKGAPIGVRFAQPIRAESSSLRQSVAFIINIYE